MNITIARPEDIERVCEIIQQLTPGEPHDYRDAVFKFCNHIQNNPDYRLWVAVIHGEVVGTAMIHLQHKLSYRCGTAAHLEDVVVDKAFRGQGIGKKLVETAINFAREHGCYKIMLTCWDRSVAYYESLGFHAHDHGMRIELKQLYQENT